MNADSRTEDWRVPPLLEELDRLRAALTNLELQKRALEQHVTGLRIELDTRASEHERLNQLYITSVRLHATCNRSEVLRVVEETLAFFIGCESCAVFELDDDEQGLRLLSAQGVDHDPPSPVPVGRGRLGRAALAQDIDIAPSAEPDGSGGAEEDGLVACVPLRVDGRAYGVIALYGLTEPKTALSATDVELLRLLSTHAASALYLTRLHERRTRQAAQA